MVSELGRDWRFSLITFGIYSFCPVTNCFAYGLSVGCARVFLVASLSCSLCRSVSSVSLPPKISHWQEIRNAVYFSSLAVSVCQCRFKNGVEALRYSRCRERERKATTMFGFVRTCHWYCAQFLLILSLSTPSLSLTTFELTPCHWSAVHGRFVCLELSLSQLVYSSLSGCRCSRLQFAFSYFVFTSDPLSHLLSICAF